MPLLFSYGSLQQEDVQLATFGRKLTGVRDELLQCEESLVRIDDPQVAAVMGTSHHANLNFSGKEDSRVSGMIFEITEDELGRVDEYETAFAYSRISVVLASGRQAWVYVHDTEE